MSTTPHASPEASAGTSAAAPPARADRQAGGVAHLPQRIVLVVVALAIAAGITVTLGQFRPWITLPLAAVIIALAWRPFTLGAGAAPVRDSRVGALWAVGGSAVWVVVNLVLTSEYLIVVRDPGFLTLTGLWLVHHPSTDIPVLGADQAALAQRNMLPDAAQAWNLHGDMIQPQGAKMLPATIAIGGWIAGEWGVLGANISIGAVGLLAVYILGTRFLGPRMALAPMAAVGLTVAHIALSRSAYSEPLTLLLVIAGAAWAWEGLERRRSTLVIAGSAAIGATTLIRIDGALFAAGALVGLVIALALSREDRRWRVTTGLAAIAAQAVFVAVGYWSLWRWSFAYADRLGTQTIALMVGYGALVGALLLWTAAWVEPLGADRIVTAPVSALGRRGAMVVGALLTALLVVLAARPLFTTVHRGTESSEDQFTNSVVQAFQTNQGLPIDPTRTYAESTMTWISYYLTWPIVLLALLGLGLGAFRALRGRSAWMLFLGAVLAPSLLYLWSPEIVPDQIWAIRRFEPMTIPGFALAAMAGGAWIASRVSDPWRQRLARNWAVGLVAFLPLVTWISIQPHSTPSISGATPLVVREMGGSRDQLHALCDVVDGRPIVLAGTSSHFGSLRVMCDEPVVLALVAPTQQALTEMSDAFGQAPVVLTRDTTWFTWTQDPQVIVESTVRQASYQLGGIPRSYFDRQYSWYAGVVQPDGTLAPIAPSTTP